MLFCPDCGYDLQGIASERCPECGLPIDRAALARSQIPWNHRKQIGAWRAYWRTVGLVFFSPKKLAAEIARPVSYRDAQLFRWITVAGLTIDLGALLARAGALVSYGHIDTLYDQLKHDWHLPIDPGAWIFIFSGIGLILGLIAVTGVISYFSHPRSLPIVQQNRAIALSYYLCAVLVPAVLCLDGAALIEWGISWFKYDFVAEAPAPIVLTMGILELVSGLILVAFVLMSVIVLKWTTRCGFFRQAAAGVALLICIGLIPALGMGLPIAAGWVALILGW